MVVVVVFGCNGHVGWRWSAVIMEGKKKILEN